MANTKFINISICNYHSSDFGLDAEWVFHATSHGKTACDGVGGTVKRVTARASLQRPIENQILRVEDMFIFRQENIKGIEFILISTEDVKAVR